MDFNISARKIADFLKGDLVAPNEIQLTGVSSLEQATSQDIVYISDPKKIKYLESTQAGLIFLKKGILSCGKPVLFLDDPKWGFLKFLQWITAPQPLQGQTIHPSAVISEKANLPRNIIIGPHTVIESEVVIGDQTQIGALTFIGKKTKIGSNCMLHPQVTIREKVTLGNYVEIHSGTTVGTDGYGYLFREGKHQKMPQIGTVEIKDHVEIGSNSCINRAALEKTVIGEGAKIGDLVEISHNDRIGKGCLIISQTGISGSCTVGDFVTLAGQVGIGDHVTIGNQVQMAARSGTTRDISAKTIVSGKPARPIQEQQRIYVLEGKLPQMYKDLKELKNSLKQKGLK